MRQARLILTCLVAVLSVATGPVLAQDAEGMDSTLALPAEWETYYVAFLRPGPDMTQTPEEVRAIMDAHIQYQLRLQESGKAVVAGGFAPDSTSNLIGITLLRAASEEQAEEWAQADPAVEAGRFAVDVRTWYVPAGLLPKP